MATRRELINAIADRYRSANRALRRTCEGAEAKLSTEPNRAKKTPYTEAVVQALTILWEAADRICGKRLKTILPTLVESMERHGHLCLDSGVRTSVLEMSAATMDRMFKPVREAGSVKRRRSHNNTPLRQSIAVRTFNDWNDPPPGFFEMDMVAHCGKLLPAVTHTAWC